MTTPPKVTDTPRTWSELPIKQKVYSALSSVVIITFILGVGGFFFYKYVYSPGDTFEEATPAPTLAPTAAPAPAILPAPAVTLAPTITPEEAAKMITVCQTVAETMLELNRRGWTDRETVLMVANQLGVTLEQMSAVMDVCVTYYGNLVVGDK